MRRNELIEKSGMSQAWVTKWFRKAWVGTAYVGYYCPKKVRSVIKSEIARLNRDKTPHYAQAVKNLTKVSKCLSH